MGKYFRITFRIFIIIFELQKYTFKSIRALVCEEQYVVRSGQHQVILVSTVKSILPILLWCVHLKMKKIPTFCNWCKWNRNYMIFNAIKITDWCLFKSALWNLIVWIGVTQKIKILYIRWTWSWNWLHSFRR